MLHIGPLGLSVPPRHRGEPVQRFLASVNQKPLAKASPESVGGSRVRWRSRAETVQGAACVREALFREYWPLREHFCRPRQPEGRRSSKSNSVGSANRTRTRNLPVNSSCGIF